MRARYGVRSNLLLPDAGLDALVIRLGKGLDRLEPLAAGRWRVGAGLPQPTAARKTSDAGFSGLHRYVGVAVVIFFVLIMASAGTFIIPPGHRGVQKRFVFQEVAPPNRA